MISYNLVVKNLIIGHADINYADTSAVIELFIYGPQLQQVGLALTDKGDWHDFQEVADLEKLNIPDTLIRGMLATMIKSFQVFSRDSAIEKRKEVFNFSVGSGSRVYELLMIRDLKPFATERRPHEASVLLYDPEQFDLWRFSVAASDGEIAADVFAYLR
ncbi:hypothetical protein LX99_04530 [Mucilaginibacter oryzae]|uniref:Uncharacterized protein n=1 Tax=Mucilaginibacter oryzae TaxID=468058 RepID=A0A316HFN5_9SPHI|nr:hypothetical protein [Mucilaginibacter oryzae]PWK70823.1 hypothetical protein LX99_04530 [Mucilaginibacter oryzae]